MNDIVEVPVSRHHSRLPAWLLALRPRHWVKNVLVIVPLAAAHQLGDLALLARVAMAFAAFSLCASGLYVLNDLFDLEADRGHPSKRRRPLASGEMTRTTAFALIAVMWLGAALVAAQLGMAFSGVLAAYVLLMIAYSVRLKHVVLLDALLLAAGYSARIAAGAVAVVDPSVDVADCIQPVPLLQPGADQALRGTDPQPRPAGTFRARAWV